VSYQFAGYGSPIPGYCEMPAKLVDTSNPDAWYWSKCGAARSSKCPPCAEVKRGDVAAVGRSGWVDCPSDRGYFVTLTAPGADVLRWDVAKCNHGSAVPCSGKIGCKVDEHDLARWHDGLGQRWSWFITELRRLLGCDVQFFKTWELQSRGALHTHSMLKVDGPVTDRRFRAAVRLAASRWGFGRQVDVQMVDLSDSLNAAKAAGYCAKYASKSADDLTGVDRLDVWGEIRPVGLRSWSASRRWGDTMSVVRQRRCAWAAAAATANVGGAAANAMCGGTVGAALDPYQNIYATGLDQFSDCGVSAPSVPL